MEIELTRGEIAFIERKVRSGEFANEIEVLKEGLRALKEQSIEERRAYEAWREDARRKIDEGYEECLRGETLDGEEVFERALLRLDAMRERCS